MCTPNACSHLFWIPGHDSDVYCLHPCREAGCDPRVRILKHPAIFQMRKGAALSTDEYSIPSFIHLEWKGGGRDKRGASGGPAARRWDAKSLCGLEVWHWRRLVLLDVLCTYEKFKEVVHVCLLQKSLHHGQGRGDRFCASAAANQHWQRCSETRDPWMMTVKNFPCG
jgi:hypothetical protein